MGRWNGGMQDVFGENTASHGNGSKEGSAKHGSLQLPAVTHYDCNRT